ncbi:hypothetical protein GCM10009530_63290 [Microbispora corallina]|uniref:Transposase n=1 Tax=Microbispora corallina TaxID=83302 RepID=A0ABQ4GBH3_9ACTN|nr:hypothetical protein [Microbispora corallina]GIH44441.1 hypothetical protein Mco01_74410 [Microbispora corallina]
MTANTTGRDRTARAVWVPKWSHTKELLALYGQLVAENATPARIRREMGLGERQIQRYAAAYRAQQE